MKDDKLLEYLYRLQGLKSPDREEFISSWIDSTLMEIARDSSLNVGYGNHLKTIDKYLKKNRKEGNGADKILIASSKGVYVFTDWKHFGIKMQSSLGLPVKKLNTIADVDDVVRSITSAKINNTKQIVMPTRAEIDYTIRKCRAEKVKAVYDFGNGLPKVDAHYLLDIMTFFPSPIAKVNKMQGESSSVYLMCTPFEGILLPNK